VRSLHAGRDERRFHSGGRRGQRVVALGGAAPLVFEGLAIAPVDLLPAWALRREQSWPNHRPL
jgi:hypothetical protein